MQTKLVVMTLLVLAMSCRAETEDAPACAEARANYNSCTTEKGHNNCWQLYFQILGDCYSKAWQKCAETEYEYQSKGCGDAPGEEQDESCGELKDEIQRICTNEWYQELDQPTEAASVVEK